MGRTQGTNLKKGWKHGAFFEVGRENTDSKRLFHRSWSEAALPMASGCLCYARELAELCSKNGVKKGRAEETAKKGGEERI
jgi:hypothetical protein